MGIEKISNLLNYYDIDFKEIKEISFGLANFNYLIIDKFDKKYFLKIYRYKSMESVKNEISFITYLVNSGFLTPKLIKNKNDEFITKLNEKICVVFEYIDGRHPIQTIESIKKIGKLMSKLHNIEVSVKLNSAYSPNLKDIKEYMSEFKTHFNLELHNLFQKVLQKVQSIPFDSLPKSAVHCDIFLDNLIELNSDIFLIDFEELAYENSIFDICRAMYGCCFKKQQIDLSLAKVMIEEYQKYRKLTNLEKEYIYEYTLYIGFVSLFWRYREFNINRKDREKSYLYMEFENVLRILLNMDKDIFIKEIF